MMQRNETVKSSPGAENNQSLGTKLIRYFMLFCFVFIVLMTAGQLLIKYDYKKKEILRHLDYIESAYGEIIVSDAYDLDQRGLDMNLAAILRFDGIEFVEVRERSRDSEEVLAKAGNPDSPTNMVRMFTMPYVDAVAGEAEGVKIEVRASTSSIVAHVLREASFYLLVGFLGTVTFALGITAIIRRFLLVPERNEAEENLNKSEARYRSVIAVSNTGAWEFHHKEKYLWCSPEYFKMLGRNPDDYPMDGTSNLEESWIDLIHPDDRQSAVDHFGNYLDAGSVGMYENVFRMSHVDGSWVWIWSRGQTIRNLDGSVSDCTVGTHINITERKQAEDLLNLQKIMYQSVVETQHEMICRYLPDTTLVFVNDAYCRAFDISPDELVGQKYLMFLPQEIHEEEMASLNRLTPDKPSAMKEYWIPLSDGSSVWQEWEDQAFFDENGKIIEIQGVGRDITKRKLAEDELKRQKTQLEQRNRALKQFNYAVSHELKTPLVSIESSLGLIQSTLSPTMDTELSKAFGYARQATRQMDTLLESLLLMFRIDAENSDTETTACGVLVQDAVDQLTRESKLKGIKMTIAPEGPELCGDRHQLVQIWLQLIENAAKFMGDQKHPAIAIGAEQTAQEMVFYVRDNGMGIEQPYQAKIFGLFDKLNKTTAGTGMGLTLAQRIIDYYGGTIRVESAGAGQGSCFYFTLPGALIN